MNLTETKKLLFGGYYYLSPNATRYNDFYLLDIGDTNVQVTSLSVNGSITGRGWFDMVTFSEHTD